jgi:hypothetical protein
VRLIFRKQCAAKYRSRTPACRLPAGRQGWQESRQSRDLIVKKCYLHIQNRFKYNELLNFPELIYCSQPPDLRTQNSEPGTRNHLWLPLTERIIHNNFSLIISYIISNHKCKICYFLKFIILYLIRGICNLVVVFMRTGGIK